MSYNQGKNHPKFIELKGKQIGELTVLEYIKNPKDSHWVWHCKCSCDNDCFVRTTKLTSKTPQKYCKSCSLKYSNTLENHKALKNKLYNRYKRVAQSKNLPFELSFENFCDLISSNCAYCGEPPKEYKGEKYFKSNELQEVFKRNGIDKKIPSKGYTLENSVSCCDKCNRAKLDYKEEEFYKWIKQTYEFLRNKETFNDYPEREYTQASGKGGHHYDEDIV